MKQIFSSKLFDWAVIVAVISVVGYAMFLSGSPGTQRALQLDNQRVSDLQQIAFAIDEYWARNMELPETLDELQDSRYYFIESGADPETMEPYEYRVLEDRAFELCAVFTMEMREDNLLYKPFQRVWAHDAGRTCFELEVQPKLEEMPRVTP